jgi:hypothetical protein
MRKHENIPEFNDKDLEEDSYWKKKDSLENYWYQRRKTCLLMRINFHPWLFPFFMRQIRILWTDKYIVSFLAFYRRDFYLILWTFRLWICDLNFNFGWNLVRISVLTWSWNNFEDWISIGQFSFKNCFIFQISQQLLKQTHSLGFPILSASDEKSFYVNTFGKFGVTDRIMLI